MNEEPSLRINVLRTRTEIEALREFWVSCNPCRDADLDFFLFILDVYPEVQRPHVVVLYERDVPKAILAGRLELRHIPVKLGYFTFPAPMLRILQIVHGGWLGDISDANAKLLLGSIINALAVGEADAASLHSPEINSPLVRYARTLPSLWCSDFLISQQARRVREVSGNSGSFLASLSQNERYQQRKRARNLAAKFNETRIQRFDSPGGVEPLMRDAEIIAAKSYQRALSVGFAETPTIRSRLKFEASKGWMRGYILYLDGQPSAFWIGSLRNQVFLSDYLSFDSAYGKYAPGVYLILKVMEELQDQSSSHPVRLFDFGIGDAAYKERLASHHWQEATVYMFAPRLKPLWVSMSRALAGTMNYTAKRLLRLTPWFGTVKRKWRASMTKTGD